MSNFDQIPDKPDQLFDTKRTEFIKLSPRKQDIETRMPKSSQFFEILSKKRIARKIQTKPESIVSELEIFSEEILYIPDITYYKFPFHPKIPLDDSDISKDIYKEFKKSFINVFNSFKTTKNPFSLLFNEHKIEFNSITTLPLFFKTTLIKNDIKFMENTTHLALNGLEIAMFFDIILNSKPSIIPFIISKYPFLNSIYYKTSSKKLSSIKYKNTIKHHYLITGYLRTIDFRKYIQYDQRFKDTL